MKTILLFLIILCLTKQSYCQKQGQEKIDSLFSVLNTANQDSVKVNSLNVLSFEFRSNDPDTAIYLANEALALATKANYKMGIANAYLSLGIATKYLGKYEEALKNYMDALKICNDLLSSANTNDRFKVLVLKAWAYNNMGNIYFDQGNYSEALKANFTALKIKEELGDKSNIAASYNNIGNIYVAQGNYPEGLKNLFAALKIKEELGDKKSVANSYNNIGMAYYNQHQYPQSMRYHLAALKLRQEIGDKNGIASSYTNIGMIYNDKGNYSEALKYQLDALKIEKDAGDEPGIADSYGNIGLIYMHQKEYDKALQYLLLYLKSSEAIEDKSGIANACINIGMLYVEKKKIVGASFYLNKGLSLAKEIGRSDFIKDAYNGMAHLDSAQGNFKQAFGHYKMYINYRDSLFNEENTKKLVQSQMQYEFDKKESLAKASQEKKDAEAKRVKNIQYFTIAALTLIILGVVVIALIQYRHNKHKQQANLLLQQQKQKVECTLSELKSTQAQLIQSEKMASLGQLTAGIAHEIQNPLNFVNNFSEVNKELIEELRAEKDNPQVQEEIINDIEQNLDKIIHHGKRADSIVKGMLEHSRTNTGKKELTNINALVDESLRLSYHGMRAKDKDFNATINIDFDESVGKLNIVPQDISRVLLNLFNNAFYVVNEKKGKLNGTFEPSVSVCTKKQDDKVEIQVKDNGNGISQNIIDKIFQPFFTTKPTGQGTGLGLSLSYDIIKAHAGEIKVESTTGEGSAFVLVLPMSKS